MQASSEVLGSAAMEDSFVQVRVNVRRGLGRAKHVDASSHVAQDVVTPEETKFGYGIRVAESLRGQQRQRFPLDAFEERRDLIEIIDNHNERCVQRKYRRSVRGNQ